MTGRPPNLIDEAQQKRLCAAYQSGETTIYALARRFRIREERVVEYLEQHGVRRRVTKPKRA